ncbi:MAG: fluoride efflux transporter CrcB [Pseudomonadota bacterium]
MWASSAAVALGGATGALLRFWASNGIHALLGRGFPWGTLSVNVFGSLLMGVLLIGLTERMELSPVWRHGLVVGLLGAFTTFATFSMETLRLLEDGEFIRALANVLANVVLCLLAAWIGVLLARAL